MQKINHSQSNQEQKENHIHPSYRCYLRTPDMRSKIHNVRSDQSVFQLKEKVKSLLDLSHDVQTETIKLVVNQVQLGEETDLQEHLFNNAIIHVLIPVRREQSEGNQISVKIKQPPLDCPILQLGNVRVDQTVKKLKARVIDFYLNHDPNNQIAQLEASQLYLVYGGKIMIDDKILQEYDISSKGVLYVVNAKIYSRQLTKQQAKKRIQSVENKYYQNPKANPVKQQSEQNPIVLNKSSKQNQAQNIKQDDLHDLNSHAEQQTVQDLLRSNKITSLNFPNEDDVVVQLEENDEKPHHQNEAQLQNQQAEVACQQQEEQSMQEQQKKTVVEYLDKVVEAVTNAALLSQESRPSDKEVEGQNVIQ